MARNPTTLIVFFIAIGILLHSSATRPAPQPTSDSPALSTGAVTYTVGDTIGWTIPTTGASFYATWAFGKTFRVGDILVFNYQNSLHDVEEVTNETYNSCRSITDPLATYSDPPVRVILEKSGPHYFICGVPGHCSIGQKLSINVIDNTTSPSSDASPPSITATPSSPSPAASERTQKSGASSLGSLRLFATMLFPVVAATLF